MFKGMYEFIFVIAILVLVSYFFIKHDNSKKILPTKKTVLITGCDSGVGLFLALTTHQLGFHVIATCLDSRGYGASLLRETSSDILIVAMDVTKLSDVENALQTVKDYLKRTDTCLWAIINNAGVLVYGHFDWQLESQALLQVNVNLIGVLRVTKAFQSLVRQAKGRIINITSANGHWCLPGLSVYCGTKHALEGFSNSLRIEMIPWNVNVILINPGNIPGSTRLLSAQTQHAEAMKRNFSEEDIRLYGDYFERFQQHLQKNFSSHQVEQTQLKDDGLKKVLESSLLLENPRHYYENLPLGMRIFILVTKLLPTYYADRMMLWMWGSTVGYKLI